MTTIRNIILISALCLLAWAAPALAEGLKIGDTVPNFTLTDQNGKKRSLNEFRGKGVVVSFLYTQCPFPNKCPMIKKKLMGLTEVNKKIGTGNKLEVLAITLDPARDKPAVLKAYAQGFDKEHPNWHFLTGSEDDIARVAGAFGVLYWDEKGVVEHNMRTAFIDPAGNLRILKSGSDWKPGEFAAEIAPLLK